MEPLLFTNDDIYLQINDWLSDRSMPTLNFAKDTLMFRERKKVKLCEISTMKKKNNDFKTENHGD